MANATLRHQSPKSSIMRIRLHLVRQHVVQQGNEMILCCTEEHAVYCRTAASVVPITRCHAVYVFDCLAQQCVVFGKFGRIPKRHARMPKAPADEDFCALEHDGDVLCVHASLVAIIVAHSHARFRL